MFFATISSLLVIIHAISGLNAAAIPMEHFLSRRSARFAEGDTIHFDAADQVKLGQLLGSGAEGAAWKVHVPKHGDLVAKEMFQPLTAEAEFAKTEKAGQYVAKFKQGNGAIIGFYKLIPGEKLGAFPEWERVKTGDQEHCKEWMKKTREAIADVRVAYARDHHIIHDDYANQGNVLFTSGSGSNHVHVDLIDWGHSTILPSAPSTSELQKIHAEAITKMTAGDGLNPFSDSKCSAGSSSSPAKNSANSGGKSVEKKSSDPLFHNPW